MRFSMLVSADLVFASCGEYYKRESPQLTIAEGLDTTWIRKEPNHGFYEINDTLTLHSAYPLLDSFLCDTLTHRSKPLWSSNNDLYVCTISDLYPPFKVYKRIHSDTIFVIKHSNVLRFTMK